MRWWHVLGGGTADEVGAGGGDVVAGAFVLAGDEDGGRGVLLRRDEVVGAGDEE